MKIGIANNASNYEDINKIYSSFFIKVFCENNLKINFETNYLHFAVIDLILLSFVSKFSVYYIPLNFHFTPFNMAGELTTERWIVFQSYHKIFLFFSSYLRSISYREYIQLVYGHIGKRRIPLPPCAYNAIRTKFEGKLFKGYEDDDHQESAQSVA